MEQMTKSAEARVAAVKLERLGYTDGCVLEGGWSAWLAKVHSQSSGPDCMGRHL